MRGKFSFGWVRGAETPPAKHADAYQFITLRTGKRGGTYNGWDFDTEVEYGFTDRLQASISVMNRYIYIHVNRGWQSRRNRTSGGGLLTAFGILTLTGCGLYYAGGEKLRAWTGFIHLWLGLALPIFIALHVWLGHRSRRALRAERVHLSTHPSKPQHAHP